jgi:ribulose bisphosphate carboxylase small subunit
MMDEKKQKRLELQMKQIYWTGWETEKRFKSIHFNEAMQSCDALAKKYGPAYSVRLFDVFTK